MYDTFHVRKLKLMQWVYRFIPRNHGSARTKNDFIKI